MGIYRDLNDYEVMYLIEEQDENAKDLLFEKYKPIVVKMAAHYKNDAKRCGLDIDDLIQEGYLGLYNAIQTFDSNNDVLFYTYALISIRSKILNILTVKSAIKHRALNYGISLSKVVSPDQETCLIDVLDDKNAILPHLMVEENEIIEIIHRFLLSLSFNQSLVFELKLNGFKNSDIVQLLDMSPKSVNNTIFQIRKKLKQYLTIFNYWKKVVWCYNDNRWYYGK